MWGVTRGKGGCTAGDKMDTEANSQEVKTVKFGRKWAWCGGEVGGLTGV